MNKKNVLLLLLAVLMVVPVDAQKKQFEGEMEYSIAVTCDKTFRKLYTWLRNGEFKSTTICRGQDALTTETYMGTSALVLPSKGEMYIWSDLLKKGYKIDYNTYLEQNKLMNEQFKTEKQFTGQEKDILGYHCKEYKATAIQEFSLLGDAGLKTVTDRNYWVCEDFIEQYMSTTPVEGLFFYNDETTRVGLPLLGEGVQHYLAKMVSIKERPVSDEELTVPVGIKFEVGDPLKAQQKLAKEIRKYKKKHKIEDDGIKEDGVSNEKGEWDF